MPLLENYDLANASPGLLGGSNAALNPYQPTLRDRIAAWMMGNQPATPERHNFVSGLVGSTGLGNTGMNVADLTPVGAALGLQEAAQHKDPVGGLLNAAAFIPGAAVGKAAGAAGGLLKEAAPAVEDTARGILAYHGSPHSFDKFDLSKIGTGEGAQAYGHGLYFADNEGVARGYRDDLSSLIPLYKGQKITGETATGNALQDSILRDMAASKEVDPYVSADRIYNAGTSGKGPYVDWSELRAARDALAKDVSRSSEGGSMYQVRINADPAHFLDWDKPLSEQHPNVQAALAKHDPDMYHPNGGDYDPTELGQSIYQRLANSGKQDATSVLKQAQVPGIKYLDAGSRTAGDGSHNYVVFDDKLIDILKKYGLPIPVAGAGLDELYGAQPTGQQ